MNKIFITLLLLICPYAVHAAPDAIKATDVFTRQAGRFCFQGQPFAEISFNKFDLFWVLWGGLHDARKPGGEEAWSKALQTQNAALADLHKLGFRTIRIFGAPYTNFGHEWEHDPAWRADLFKVLDATLDLCEKNDMAVIFCLGTANLQKTTTRSKITPNENEERYDLVINPASPARQRAYNYLDTLVARYKNRKSIVMWDVTNELTNMADIGKWKGAVAPTLRQVAEFFDSVAKRIKANDPLRLVSTGGSHLREYAWRFSQGQRGRQRDTWEEHQKAYAAYFQNSALDVVDVHYYAVRTGGYELAAGPDGQPVRMTPSRYVQVMRGLGKGLIFGEYGPLPAGWSDNGKQKEADADWFNGYNDPNAKQWVQRAVDDVITAGVPLVYFWCYSSDRPQDQKENPITFSLARTPELMQIIAAGNQRLKIKLGAH